MSWRDAAALGGRDLRRNPGRSLLTVIAVALGAALLSALLSIADTARTRVLSQVSHGGSLAGISVEPARPNPTQAGLDNPTPGPPRDLTAAALEQIHHLPHVTRVVAVTAAPVRVVTPQRRCPPRGGGCGSGEFGSSLLGVDLSDTTDLPVSLVAGRYPAPDAVFQVDVTQDYLQRVGVTSARAASVVGTKVDIGSFRLLPGPGRAPVGFRWVQATVVGVVDEQAAAGALLAWPPLAGADFTWTAAGRAAGDSDAPTSPYAGALVSADNLGNVTSVRTAIAEVGYNTSAPQNLLVSVQRYLHVVELVLSAIGGVALAIAAIGISNALLASVRERRREIGIMKALGARDRDVLTTFLVEAGAVGLAGGVVGAAAGTAVATVIGAFADHDLAAQGLRGVSLSVPPLIVVVSVVGSVAVALLAGALPARRAARLSPREAVSS
jgi:putative ABC transport system permease protein